MWYLKFKYKHNDCLFTNKVHQLDLKLQHFYLGQETRLKTVYVNVMQKLTGDQKNIERYVRYLKRHPRIKKIKQSGNVVLLQATYRAANKGNASLYNSGLVYPQPASVTADGAEVVHLAHWDRKKLVEIFNNIKSSKQTTVCEMLHLRQANVHELYTSKLMTKLSPKQKQSVELARELGYYEHPRKITMQELAKIAKTSKQTFSEHLQKAHAKLLRDLF